MNDIATTLKENTYKPVKITITLPTHAYFMSGIRDFTLSLIKNTTEFSEQWAYRFQSVVDELANNAIEHGSQPGEEIKITFIYNPNESIEIQVEDSGTGKDARKAEEIKKIVDQYIQQSVPMANIRGRGLAKIVHEWTDELEFIDKPEGGLKVKVVKYLTHVETEELKKSFVYSEDKTHILI
ncbi:ATP-binding protein [Candidatus Peregrinibacteria bacterium]|nr:ATP-binding protein [Candidatus Peregrinibacteria bacterium]